MFDQGAGAASSARRSLPASWAATPRTRVTRLAPAPEFPVEVAREAEAPRGEQSDAFGAVAVEVEVDRGTGQITVLQAALAADTGTVISPLSHRGQLEGGFVFGLGAALMEELPVEDGQVLAGSLGDYKLPTAPDVPPLTFGAKAVGEFGNLGVAPAIAGAVARAVGVRLQELPLTSEAVWSRLVERP
jgi:CO/xanthine dehydrogenase Mo-binding subunit